MHEMSIAESVVQIIEDQAQAEHYSKVRAVWLEIGQFAGVEVEALRFCFDAVCKGTVAEDAELNIVDVAAKATCMNCGAEVVVQNRFDPCPECGGYQLQMTGGDELRIKEMEVDRAPVA